MTRPRIDTERSREPRHETEQQIEARLKAEFESACRLIRDNNLSYEQYANWSPPLSGATRGVEHDKPMRATWFTSLSS